MVMLWEMLAAFQVPPNPSPPTPTFTVPNPAPEAPPGLEHFGSQIIAWLKWGVLIGGMAGLLICAGMIILGRRNRSSVAQDGLVGAIWVLGGLALAGVAWVIVTTFMPK